MKYSTYLQIILQFSLFNFIVKKNSNAESFLEFR